MLSLDQISSAIVGSGQRQHSQDSADGTRKSFGWFVTDTFSLYFEVEKYRDEKRIIRKSFSSIEKAVYFYNSI